MAEITVREEVAKVVSMLESGVSELTKTVMGLRELIQTIDAVLFRLETVAIDYSKVDVVDDADSLDDGPTIGAGECFYRWWSEDINDLKVVMTEQHWQTYASQDWFAGFKSFPRCQKTFCPSRNSLLSDANKSRSFPRTFYMQVADVLLQIEKILHGLECKTSPQDSDSASDSSEHLFRQSDGRTLRQRQTSKRDRHPDYYVLSADVMGDYEEKLDKVLENIQIGASSEDEETEKLNNVTIPLINFEAAQSKRNIEDKIFSATDYTENQLESYFD